MHAVAPGRILLVEDERPIAENIIFALEQEHFTVKWVSKGGDAISALPVEQPDFFILDINLPDMTGWEVLAMLSSSNTSRIPVIVHSIDDDRQRALNAGACELLVKPADRDVLEAAALRFARVESNSTPTQASVISSMAKIA